MKRLLFGSLFAMLVAVVAVATLEAQSTAGWKIRADRSTNASDPDAAGEIEFMAMGGGFHAITPQAGVFWHPSSTASGSYTLKGNFTQRHRTKLDRLVAIAFLNRHVASADSKIMEGFMGLR